LYWEEASNAITQPLQDARMQQSNIFHAVDCNDDGNMRISLVVSQDKLHTTCLPFVWESYNKPVSPQRNFEAKRLHDIVN
jgi:hypothetical protein